MIIIIFSGVVLVSLLLLFLLRYSEKMAALLTWLVGSLSARLLLGPREEESANNTETASVATSKSKASAKNKNKKQYEDPTLTTTLTAPIEDVIEETIGEELTETPSVTKKKTKVSKPQEKPKKASHKQEVDDVGYSFFKVKSVELALEKPQTKARSVEVKEETATDEIGFSFLPVREKGKRYKTKKEEKETLNTFVEKSLKKTKVDLSKPSIIDHYRKKPGKQAVVETVPVVRRRFSDSFEKVQHFVAEHRLEEKRSSENLIKSDPKESKKVTSEVSYASVVTNNSSFDKGNTEETTEEEKNQSKELIGHENFNNTKEPDQHNGFEIIRDNLNILLSLNSSLEQIEDISKFFNEEKIKSRSRSSSICVIDHPAPEEIQEEHSYDISTQFVHTNSSEDKNSESCRSKNSSISVIDNPSDFEETREDLLAEDSQKFDSYIIGTVISDFTQQEKKENSLQTPVEKTSAQIGQQGVEFVDSIKQYADSNNSIGIVQNIKTSSQSPEKSIKQEAVSEHQKDSTLKQQLEEVADTLKSLEQSLAEPTRGVFNKVGLENCTEYQEGKQLEGILSVEKEQFLEEPITEDSREIVLKDPKVHQPKESSKEFILEKENIDPRLEEIDSTVLTKLESEILEFIPELTEKKPSKKSSRKPLESSPTQNKVNSEEKLCIKRTAYTTGDSKANTEEDRMHQIRVLTLNDKQHQESTIYRIEKNWSLQFRIGSSLFGRKVFLYCNYPIESEGKFEDFNRSRYQLLEWIWDEGCKNADDTAAYAEITARIAGSFHYYFTYEKGKAYERHGSGYFLVDPVLKYGNDETLPLDCIQCQTVLAKNLGSFSTWENKLRVAKESGYNMIHFTPIQKLGVSNSSYSLSEQLKLNPVFKKENDEIPTFEEIELFVSKLRNEWKVNSICDIVLNHTANESLWIKEHSEVTYNCVNCPYLRPAYLLDAAFHQFSMDVKRGVYEDRGIPVEVNNEDHLDAIRYHFRINVLEPLKIHELFVTNVNKYVIEFLCLARTSTPRTPNAKDTFMEELKLYQDPEYKRLSASVDLGLALKLYNVYWNDTYDEDSRLKRCAEVFKHKLDALNNAVIGEINDHLTVSVDNVIAGIRYFRVQHDGPRFKEITVKTPLVYRYFTDYGTPKSLKEHEDIMYDSDKGRFLMAHNGWVMNSDPLKNFAAPDSKVYIRRELIAWGDSVKLRFGDKPEDCPFLWEYMRKYVQQTARIFDGVRLDNCHSTPIPVAEYLLDCARAVRPDLYVVAELFTNSDMTDNIFVNRLGITSLIREAMSAWDSHEEGRLVYRYGGVPVGSFYQPSVRPLVPCIAHALFLDMTHDNPSPVEKRSVFDLLPSSALVNMACCASGSNRGYDELVPHHIHVVDETREYTEWTDDEKLAVGNARYVTIKSGIISAKKALNDLHFTLGREGFNQVYVDQMDPDIVAVTRHNPETHKSYILVSFTAFGHPPEDAAANCQRNIKPLRFEGVLEEIVLEATLSHVGFKSGASKFAKFEDFIKDSKWINGLSDYQVNLKQHIQVEESDIFEQVNSGSANVIQLDFKNFKPGSVIVVRASLPEMMNNSVKIVRELIKQFSLSKEKEFADIIDKLTLADLNRVLYRCDQEERDEGFGFDTYNVPNLGRLVYAGLQGIISVLANIRPNNDLGHPVCANLRDGNWMIEYVANRLKLDAGTKDLGNWISKNTECFKNIPRYLIPCYFDVVVTGIYVLLLEQSYRLMAEFVKHGSTFVKGLSLGSLQFAAYIKSADLPVLSPNLAPPKPLIRKNEKGQLVQACVALSAGLPHFSVGYMRNWGRDTFIALRGLFILTGRYQEAREHILGYAACLRHGLIPNLLDGGRNPRFNCRDAIWWWLYCIKEYAEQAPDGISIMSDRVSRIFPTDDSPNQSPGSFDQPLYDVVQEALDVHFQGLVFRERNAGRQIDEHMTDSGFNNQIGVHPDTGFVFGGNKWNCGTWMDKMGSSDKAGNRGKPATPRDGSAVELIGLSKAGISWLWKLNQEKKYPYEGVKRKHKNGSTTKWTFKEWADKIQANFEKYLWVNTEPLEDEVRPDLINKRGIYKDSYGSSQEYTDFQLRCNFPIAMVAAPELFTPQKAWTALAQAEKYLLGPLGMKTLDPDDWAYRGDYDNSNDSYDGSIANGFNYHQGPEWVWPIGFFLRAKLIFASQTGALKETIGSTKLILSKHFIEMQTSDWRGLPELTNRNGSYCRDSSRTQAWSMSSVLEVLYDLQKIDSAQSLNN